MFPIADPNIFLAAKKAGVYVTDANHDGKIDQVDLDTAIKNHVVRTPTMAKVSVAAGK